MNHSVALTTGILTANAAPAGNSTRFSSPMTEETIDKTSQRIQSSIRDVGIITRELLKGSRSEEAVMQCAKQFAGHEQNIESCSLSISKLELLSQQLALHQECIEQALSSVEALEWKLGKLTKRRRELSKAEDVQSSVSEADQVPPTAEAIPIPSIDPNTDSVSSKDS